MLTQHGLTRRRKLKSGKRERSRIDYLLTSNLNVGQVVEFEHEQIYENLTTKQVELAKNAGKNGENGNFERNGKCEWVQDSNMVSDHYAFRFRVSA
jgi:propanediol dehydratase small subunit